MDFFRTSKEIFNSKKPDVDTKAVQPTKPKMADDTVVEKIYCNDIKAKQSLESSIANFRKKLKNKLAILHKKIQAHEHRMKLSNDLRKEKFDARVKPLTDEIHYLEGRIQTYVQALNNSV